MTILIIVVCIIALPLIIALFVRKDYSIEEEIVIEKPQQQVYDFVRFLDNQQHYSKWVMQDPQLRKTFTGADGTVGCKYAWDSDNKNVGKGEQEITGLQNGERMTSRIQFIKPFEGVAEAWHTFSNAGENQTRVKWGFSSRMKYPMNILLPILKIDKMLARDVAEGLRNLKAYLEKQPS